MPRPSRNREPLKRLILDLLDSQRTPLTTAWISILLIRADAPCDCCQSEVSPALADLIHTGEVRQVSLVIGRRRQRTFTTALEPVLEAAQS